MLTRKSKYGLKALLLLAREYDRGPILASEVAAREGIPEKFLQGILLDLRRRGIGVRELVRRMERAVVKLLAVYGVVAAGREDAPGVYVGAAKVAALGLRVRHGCCYHGIALNVDMDLAPFAAIDPCGYPGLVVTQTRDLGVPGTVELLGEELAQHLLESLRESLR